MKEHIRAEQLTALTRDAERAARGRAHLNTHDSLDAMVQRLFIATSPNTYIRPHRHTEDHKWEFFMILEGEMDLLLFDDDGTITERTRMSRTAVRAVEVPPGVWHTYVCCRSGTLALEVKQGAYMPTSGGDFAPWSPEEGDEACDAFLQWLRDAPVGDTPTR